VLNGNEIAKLSESNSIFAVQEHWQAFRKAEAGRQTEKFERGTIRPTIRNTVALELTRTRTAELTPRLESEQDEIALFNT
jgi:uncharacterized protein YecT (DUF1311 family)